MGNYSVKERGKQYLRETHGRRRGSAEVAGTVLDGVVRMWIQFWLRCLRANFHVSEDIGARGGDRERGKQPHGADTSRSDARWRGQPLGPNRRPLFPAVPAGSPPQSQVQPLEGLRSCHSQV
jgi:hypothetical protein